MTNGPEEADWRTREQQRVISGVQCRYLQKNTAALTDTEITAQTPETLLSPSCAGNHQNKLPCLYRPESADPGATLEDELSQHWTRKPGLTSSECILRFSQTLTDSLQLNRATEEVCDTEPHTCVKLETFSGRRVENKSFTTNARVQTGEKQAARVKDSKRNRNRIFL